MQPAVRGVPRDRRGAGGLAWLALAALVALAPGPARASHRRDDADDTPGHFDYYLLSLSWSPAYCLDAPGAAQCNGTRAYGFVVHGLWPQNERGWPEHCDDSSIPADLATSMLDLMPARKLVYHEWAAHGTCSGLAPEDYFRLVRRARESIRIPDGIGIGAPVEQAPASLAAAFLRANPALGTQALVVACSGGQVPRLREVRVCLTRDLKSRACSAEVKRSACRADTLIVPPVR